MAWLVVCLQLFPNKLILNCLFVCGTCHMTKTSANCLFTYCTCHMTNLTNCVQMKANTPSTGFSSWSRVDTTWMHCATLDPVMLIKQNLSTFQSQLHQKATWSLPHNPTATGGCGGLSPSKQISKPTKLKYKHCKTVVFVQISECQAPYLYKFKAPLPKTF